MIDNGSIGFERTITDFEGNGGIKKEILMLWCCEEGRRGGDDHGFLNGLKLRRGDYSAIKVLMKGGGTQ